MGMKNSEIINASIIASNIHLVFEGRGLSNKMQAKIMLMRVGLDKKVAAFNEKIQEALKGVKPEGFDDLAREVGNMRQVEARSKAVAEWNGEGEKPTEPTKEELDEAKKIREEKLSDYEEKEKVVLEKLVEIRKQELDEDSGYTLKKFTEDEYAEIISMIKSEGEYPYVVNGETFTIRRIDFLGIIAANLVE